jgi:AcrR family transcriptional regulator
MGTQTSGRRARILAATLRVVGRYGVASITTRKIAQEAGVNLSALHRYFSSKDALLLAALDEATTLMIAALPAPPAAGWSHSAALDETCISLGVLIDAEPCLPLVRCELLLYLRRHPVLNPDACRQQERYVGTLSGLYYSTSSVGEHATACHAFAELVAAMVDSLALTSASRDDRNAPGRPPGHALRVARGHSRIGDRS